MDGETKNTESAGLSKHTPKCKMGDQQLRKKKITRNITDVTSIEHLICC